MIRFTISLRTTMIPARRRALKLAFIIGGLLVIGSALSVSRSRLSTWFRGVTVSASSDKRLPKLPRLKPSTYIPRARRYREGGGAQPVLFSLPPFMLSAPASVSVTSASSSSIHVTWAASSGAVNHYLIERSTGLTAQFQPAGTAAANATSFNDTPPPGVHSYLYRVRAIDSYGAASLPSNMALGTSITFTDPELHAGETEIKKEHIYDLRAAIDAVRALVPNMGAGSYTRGDLYHQIVLANDVTELRTQLDAALSQLNVPLQSYEDSPLATGASGTPIRKKHIEQLRERSTFGQSTSSGPSDPAMDASNSARLNPMNRTGSGDDPLSRNANWSLPVVGLPGRAGLDLGLSLSYNSLVWTRNGNYIEFDDDAGSPSPGFRLGFPVIEAPYYNSQAAKTSYLLITPSGAHVELRQMDSSNHLYQAVDSSYMLLDSNTMVLKTTDGTQLSYVWEGLNYQCTQVKDRNGNYLTVHYDEYGRMDWVDDTLSRRIYFVYDGADLTTIRQSWKVDGSTVWHNWATFSYTDQTINTNFKNESNQSLTVIGPLNNQGLHVLSSVTFPDESHYDFSYTNWGQVWKISSYASSGTGNFLSYRSYNVSQDTSVQTDCPRFTERHDEAANWNLDGSGNSQEVTTGFAIPSAVTIPYISQPGTMAVVTAPDQTSQKIYYGNQSTNLPWENGLVLVTENYDNASTPVKQRWVVTSWTQDSAGSNVTYLTNPRVTSTDIYDPANNHHQTQISEFGPFGLPHIIDEYGNGTFLRRKIIDYKQDDVYVVDHHIIGFPYQVMVYDENWHLASRVQYSYDEGNDYFATQAPSTQFDSQNYPSSFIVGRGNVTGVYRYNADNETQSQRIQNIGYNQDGSVVWKSDADGNKVTISYADSFSDTNNSLNTRAYPTSVTTLETVPSQVNIVSTAQYDYDFGGVTSKQTPLPNQSTYSAGPIQTTQYDSLGRLQRLTNSFNSAYTSYEYGPNYVKTHSTVNTANDEAYSLQVVDGAGRVIAKVGNHPGSSGGYSAQLTTYDVMGRAVKVSNPTETSLSTISTSIVNPYSWSATGDDSGPGTGNNWPSTQQTYDWKGRPLVTTNPDNTTKTASYAGCGCAGGEVVSLTDEGTIDNGTAKRRQQNVYADMLGRTVKTEILNWENGSAYSTTVNTYNGRDQITLIRQYQGTTSSGTYQDTTMTYDGYGRLSTKHTPEQQADLNTVWAYNNDDTIASVTDARGASASFTRNARHLVTNIAYAAPSPIPTPSPSNFEYDVVGNRTSMSDGSGSTSYSYNQLSQLTSETRSFTGVSTTYTLSYDYNLGGELTTLSIPFNSQQIGYNYDNAGRLSSVSASGFSATYNIWPNSYTQTITSFASDIAYRAWGGRKSMTYGNTVSDSISYDSRLRPTSYALSNVNYTNSTITPSQNYTSMSWSFDYYDDGLLSHSTDSTNHWFDRGYTYDHAGRLSEATTYRRAAGLSPCPAVSFCDPYSQTMSYDVWGNTTSRSGTLYGNDQSDTATYSNNRRSGFSYDAQGNVITDSYTHKFDAVGKDVRATSVATILMNEQYVPVLDITQDYDSDGEPSQRIQVARKEQCIYVDGEPSCDTVEDTQTSHYVRSTVLGGALVEDLGIGEVSIYAGGQRIAKAVAGDVTFEQHNPATGSWVTSHGHSSYRTTLRQERDPMGAELPLSSPWGGASSYVSSKFGEPLFIEGGDPFDRTSGLTLDGMPVSEAQLSHMMDTGVAGGGLFVGGHYAGFLDFSGHGRMGMEYLRGDFGSIRVNASVDLQKSDWHTSSMSADDPGVEDETGVLGVVNVYATINLQLVNASYTPQNPTPITVRFMNQKYVKDFQKALAEAEKRLKKADCAKLFGKSTADLVKMLENTEYRVLTLASGGPTVDPNTGDVSVVGAQTNLPSTTSVFINDKGPFFNQTPFVPGKGITKLDFGSNLRGSQFGALLLLHELGHQTGIFGADAGNDKLNRQYTRQVQEACF